MTIAGEIEKRFRNNPIYVKETRGCEIRRVEVFLPRDVMHPRY